jgi:hypothetical protein
MSKKRLSIKNIDNKSCLTVRELSAWLKHISTTIPDHDVNDNHDPIVLKCGGKNFQLSQFKMVAGTPVLIGKRRPKIG